MAQAIMTQVQAVPTQAQAMTAQANLEVVPRSNQYVGSMTSHLRDFTTMNPPTFFGPRLKKTTKSSFIKYTRSSIIWGSLIEKAELATY